MRSRITASKSLAGGLFIVTAAEKSRGPLQHGPEAAILLAGAFGFAGAAVFAMTVRVGEAA
ncbi:MAG: hypothetical protein ACT4P7_12435 [Gemmatimonadaceae bacterium]